MINELQNNSREDDKYDKKKENIKICDGEIINHTLPKRGGNIDWEETQKTFKKQNYRVTMNLKLNYRAELLTVSFKVIGIFKALSSGTKETKTWKIELKDISGHLNNNSFIVNVNDMLNLKSAFLKKCTLNYIESLEKEEAKNEEIIQYKQEAIEAREETKKANKESKHQMERANKISEKLYQEQIEHEETKDELANEKEEHNKTKYELIITKKQLASVENKYNDIRVKKPQFTFDIAKEFSLLTLTKGLKKASEIINEKYFN